MRGQYHGGRTGAGFLLRPPPAGPRLIASRSLREGAMSDEVTASTETNGGPAASAAVLPGAAPASAAASSKAAAQAASRSPDASLDRLRVNIARVIQRYFQPLFLLTVGTAIFLFLIIAVGLFTGSTIATMALAASVQVAFGMIIGYVCVYIGLMMTWFGIDASYTFKGSLDVGSAKSEGALKSASPGLLFALGGMVLIAVSLYKPIVYEEKGGLPVNVRSFPLTTDDAPAADSIEPDAPPARPKR
jgi:hypothetical protein